MCIINIIFESLNSVIDIAGNAIEDFVKVGKDLRMWVEKVMKRVWG